MDWRRKRQIRNLADGILVQNVLHRPPIEPDSCYNETAGDRIRGTERG